MYASGAITRDADGSEGSSVAELMTGDLAGPAAGADESRHREAMVRRLTDLLFLPASQVSPHEKALVDEILSRLVLALVPAKRARLARRIGELADPPRRLTRFLAAAAPELAQPFLERPELFNDAELIGLIGDTGATHHLLIARRPSLSPAVSDALIATGHAETVMAVIANPGAVLPIAHFRTLMEMSRDHVALQSRLLARADFPVALALEMFWWVGAQLRQAILHRYSMERRLLVEAVADLRLAEVSAPADVDWAFRLSGASRAQSRSPGADIDLLNDWLARPEDEAIGCALAASLAIAPDTLVRIARDAGGEPHVILLKAAGFTAGQFRQFCAEMSPGLSRADREGLEALLTLFVSISTDWADLVLRQWDQQGSRQPRPESRLHELH